MGHNIPGGHMKKVLCLAASLVVLFGCACSFPSSPTTEMTEKADEADDTDVTDSSSDSDNSFSIDKPSGIKFDYPDQLVFQNGGTASMTIYRCGVRYYACVDGNHSWGQLYGTPPVSIEEGASTMPAATRLVWLPFRTRTFCFL